MKGATGAGFWTRARAFFADYAIVTIEAVLWIDNHHDTHTAIDGPPISGVNDPPAQEQLQHREVARFDPTNRSAPDRHRCGPTMYGVVEGFAEEALVPALDEVLIVVPLPLVGCA